MLKEPFKRTKNLTKNLSKIASDHPTERRPTLLHEFLFAYRFFKETLKALIAFRNLSCCITIYGSARLKSSSPYYQIAVKLGKRLSESGYTVMTGGGPGIMEAANYGASLGSPRYSAGCSVELPYEDKPNAYLTHHIHFHYLFARKLMLTKYAWGCIAFPGGLGTFDELFEIATLVKTQRINHFPIILIGKDFWTPLINYLETTLIDYHTLKKEDIQDLFFMTDSIDRVMNFLKKTTPTIKKQ